MKYELKNMNANSGEPTKKSERKIQHNSEGTIQHSSVGILNHPIQSLNGLKLGEHESRRN